MYFWVWIVRMNKNESDRAKQDVNTYYNSEQRLKRIIKLLFESLILAFFLSYFAFINQLDVWLICDFIETKFLLLHFTDVLT